MTGTEIQAIVAKQRNFFATGQTFDVEYRIDMLKKLYRAIQRHEHDIMDALYADLGKSETESYMCEIGMTLSELSYQIKHVRTWSKRTRCKTSLTNFHAKSFTIQEPYGCVLVMSPWNYPFLLCMNPLIGAISAGNCCVVKPSNYSPATSAVIRTIVEEVFQIEYVAVVEGGRIENAALLDTRFDYIFFTGGVTVGKLVMEKAAAHVTPVTLELGGKSPCIVEKSCDLKLAAKRIVFGKYLNCGQTCIAPDYILIDRTLKEDFIQLVKEQIIQMYGENPLENSDYGKIINEKHFLRLLNLIDTKKVVAGGTYNRATLQIAPTVLDNVMDADAVMQEEIFGPIMPILVYDQIEEAEQFILQREKPLALYLFTNDRAIEERFLTKVSFGGGCVNDTINHIASEDMGFGGVGYSGMGSYHGRKTFDTFTHEKSVLKKYNWIDLPMRYQPYTKTAMKLIQLFMK